MNIRELQNDSNICIKKFNFTCDDPDMSIPRPLPQILNFFLLVCGRPGSGKTTLILNLICKRGKNYNKKFDRIYLYSPSLLTINGDPFENLPEDQKFDELTADNLQGSLDKIAQTGEKVLFILDDVVNDIKKSPEIQRILTKMLMNRRHLAGAGGSTAFIITSQVYNKIPAPIRKTASQVILYHTRNKKEIMTIFDELVVISKEDFFQLLNYCFSHKNKFMYIDLNKNHNKMFYKCFNQLEFQSKNELY